MGVRGLQTFIKNNSDLLSQKVNLSNTSLVIDANNLLCQTFVKLASERESRNFRFDIYGGDLVIYGDTLKLFFENLDKCHITPILVYDGSVIGKQSTRDSVVLKEKETYRRGLDKFNYAKNATEENAFSDTSDNIFLPKLLNRVFKSIATDMGIQSIQCAYEADTHIARIANDLNCPALTNDSDFFIYPLKQGFILLDFFYYQKVNKTTTDKYPTIMCQIIRQNLLLKAIPGSKIENMPLLSILLGNDYIESGSFDRILYPIINQYYDGLLKAQTNSHKKIANLLYWLRDKTYNEAIDYILNSVHPGNRDELSGTFKILTRNYKIELTDNLGQELEAIYPDSLDPRNNVLPEHTAKVHYKRIFETGLLSSNLFDITFHNTNYNYATIDDHQLMTSSFVKFRPFSVAVTLLRPASYGKLTTYRRQISAEKDSLRIFDRIHGDYKEYIIAPCLDLEGYGSLEHMNAYSIITLAPNQKRGILISTFRFNLEEHHLLFNTFSGIFSEKFTKEATLCFLLIKYIGLETKSKPKQQFVDAVLLTIFYYAAILQQLKPNNFEDNHYGSFLLQMRPHSYRNNQIEYKSSVGLFKRIMHFISQLQHAYSSYNMLNGLFEFVHHNPKVELFFNGVLIFRITKLLRQNLMDTKSLCSNLEKLYDVCEIVRTMTYSEC